MYSGVFYPPPGWILSFRWVGFYFAINIADKGYVGARNTIIAKGAYPAVILKDNMKEKNKDKDKWLTKLRSPYEGTFSKQNKRVGIRVLVKINFLNFYML